MEIAEKVAATVWPDWVEKTGLGDEAWALIERVQEYNATWMAENM